MTVTVDAIVTCPPDMDETATELELEEEVTVVVMVTGVAGIIISCHI